MNGAIYVEESKNAKIGKNVDATYASIEATCPDTCKLKSNGCYAQMSYVGYTTFRLNRQAIKLSAYKVALAEAKAIDSSYDSGPIPEKNGIKKDLRIHVAGDAVTPGAVKVISGAVRRWKTRGGGQVWSYTHGWKTIHRSLWKHISCLASVESLSDAKEAQEQGYVPAMIVHEHKSDKAYVLEGIRWIPCPAQTKEKVSCEKCKLCFDDAKLMARNAGIAFAAHGVAKNKIKRMLPIIG